MTLEGLVPPKRRVGDPLGDPPGDTTDGTRASLAGRDDRPLPHWLPVQHPDRRSHEESESCWCGPKVVLSGGMPIRVQHEHQDS